MESCAPDYTYAFFLNATSGQLQLMDRSVDMPESVRLCALASPFVHNTDLSNLEFDRLNQSMTEFVVKRRSDHVDSRLLQFSNNTYSSLDSKLYKVQIPLNMHINEKDEHQLAFELETISFQPLKENKQLPDSLDLFSIQSQTGEVRVDPQVVEQPEGVYTLKIGAFDSQQTSKHKIGTLQSQVHFVREENRLTFIFDKPIEQIGLSVKAFTSELDTILSDLEGTKIRTVLSQPCAYDSIETRNRSQACFYLVNGENQVMSPSESINLTSTSNNPERRLFELYQQYRLISIESCHQAHKSRSAYVLGREMMSRELFVWIVLVMGAFLILLSLIGYTCFVARYKEHLWQKTLEQTAKLPPISSYATPYTATTSHAATLPNKV